MVLEYSLSDSLTEITYAYDFWEWTCDSQVCAYNSQEWDFDSRVYGYESQEWFLNSRVHA